MTERGEGGGEEWWREARGRRIKEERKEAEWIFVLGSYAASLCRSGGRPWDGIITYTFITQTGRRCSRFPVRQVDPDSRMLHGGVMQQRSLKERRI